MPSSDLGGIMQWAQAACQHGRNKKAARWAAIFLAAVRLRSFATATPFALWAKGGGARRDRTADLVNAIHALSHLSYGPVRERDRYQ